MASEKAVATQPQREAVVKLTNRTPANMQLMSSISWSGQFSAPEIIRGNGEVSFTNVKGDEGSMAGVKYSNSIPEIIRGNGEVSSIILAWDAPADFHPTASPNRVVGFVGPRRQIELMTWDLVKEQLMKAGPSFVVVVNDGITSMIGNITNNPCTKVADVVASFLPRP